MKVLKFLDKYFEEIICVVALAAMTVVIFIQIILRLISPIVQLPMAWTEEIGRYFFIYAVYVGAAYATKRMAHQKVDVLPLLVNDTGKLIFNLISDVGLIVFAAVMAIYGWQVVEQVAFIFVRNAPATKLNMGWAYGGPALGMTCCAIRAFQNIFRHIAEYKEKKKNSQPKSEGGEA